MLVAASSRLLSDTGPTCRWYDDTMKVGLGI
jgi:hypothetical protein